MREIRTSGSEGGAGRKPRSYLYRANSAIANRHGECTGVRICAWRILKRGCGRTPEMMARLRSQGKAPGFG